MYVAERVEGLIVHAIILSRAAVEGRRARPTVG
jgi:hypothetical protein